MPVIARKSDGRRIFTDRYKREQIDRVWRGELTLSELSRKLGIARSLLHRWKRLTPAAGATAEKPRTRVAPASTSGTEKYIRDLQLLLGKQAVQLELLREELDACKKGRRSQKRLMR